MKRFDVALDAVFPSAGKLASSDGTTDLRFEVNRSNVSFHRPDTRVGLVASTPAAGDGVALEVHLSEVPIAVPLQ